MYIMVLNGNDLVIYKDDKGVHAGAYMINSKMLNNLTPVCEISQNGGAGASSGVASILNGLAVPTGLLMLQQEYGKNIRVKKTNTNEVVEKGLYDKLLDLANSEDTKKTRGQQRQTKRSREKKNDKNSTTSSHKRKTKKTR